ncbi:MAG: hypothetical protein H7A37_04280 [Chlamydiales bacterium]|nr:hypothetical protein [Chlamydiia bacterium]MCP5507504.1 hypothetical protein [Chlamydiales bacterium]
MKKLLIIPLLLFTACVGPTAHPAHTVPPGKCESQFGVNTNLCFPVAEVSFTRGITENMDVEFRADTMPRIQIGTRFQLHDGKEEKISCVVFSRYVRHIIDDPEFSYLTFGLNLGKPAEGYDRYFTMAGSISLQSPPNQGLPFDMSGLYCGYGYRSIPEKEGDNFWGAEFGLGIPQIFVFSIYRGRSF